MPASKFFIALIPPEPVFTAAWKWKEYMRDHYLSSGALKSPPHITLHMPFEWEDRKMERLTAGLTALASTLQPVEITFDGFGCFEPRVIFIQVQLSRELRELQARVREHCRINYHLLNDQYRDLPFHPHLTIGFRDLRKPMFHAAWQKFREMPFEATCTAMELVLLRHNGKSWDIFQSFPFSNQ